MAKSKKASNAAKSAIDAVEEALTLDDLLEDGLDVDELAPQENDKPTNKSPREQAKLASSAKKSPANDDRHAMGKIIYNLQRRPSSAPFWWAFVISLVWLAGSAFLGMRYLDVPFASITTPQNFLTLINQGPAAVWLVATFVPIAIYFVMAFLIWRAQELRLAAHSMSEVALRLAEPENVATEAVTNVSQAVRREVAAMGDGVERVLARAGELEVLVHNEIMSLERSYSDNELRIRGLIDELSTQREAIVNNAERVSTSLNSAKMDLSNDLLSIGEKVTGDLEVVTTKVQTIGDDISANIVSVSNNLTNQIGSTGNEILSSVSTQGSDLINDLKSTAESASEQIINAGKVTSADIKTTNDEITSTISSNLSQQAETFKESMQSSTTTMMVDLSLRASEITENIDGIGNKVAELIIDKNDAITASMTAAGTRLETLFNDDGNALAERLSSNLSQQAETFKESMQSSTTTMMVDLSLRASEITENIDGIGNKVAELIIDKNDAITASMTAAGTRLETLFNDDGNALAERLTTSGDGIAKLIEERSISLIDDIEKTTEKVNQNFTASQHAINNQMSTVGEQIGQALVIGGNELNQKIAGSGLEIITKIKEKSDNLSEEIDNHLIQIDEAIDKKGSNLTDKLGQRITEMDDVFTGHTNTMSSTLQSQLDQASNSFQIKTQEITDNVDQHVRSLDEALGQQNQQINDTFASQAQQLTQTLNNQLVSSVETLEGQASNVTDKLIERVEKINLSLAGNVDDLTTNIDKVVDTLDTKTARMNQIVEVDLVNVSEKLIGDAEATHVRIMDISENSSKNFTAAADQAASIFASKTHEAGETLVGALSKLSTGIRSQASDTANTIENTTLRLQETLKTSTALAEESLGQHTSTLSEHASNLEEMIRKRIDTLSDIFNKDGARILDELDKKSVSVATNITNATSNMVENLQTQATQMVENLTIQFGDVDSLLSRINGKNEEIRTALTSADQSLSTIETGLANRAIEIRDALTQAQNHSEESNMQLAQEIGKLQEISELTIRDTAAIASRFEGHSTVLTDATAMLLAAGNSVDTTVEERQRIIENVSQGLVAKTSDIEKLMTSFAELMNETVTQAEDRAKMVNYTITSTAQKTSQEIAHQIEELQASADTQLNSAIQEATGRFANASEQMRQTAQTLQDELQATRAEIKRGIFELPAETKESTAAMRRLVGDQVRALNDLSDIVNAQRNRHPSTRQPETQKYKAPVQRETIAAQAPAAQAQQITRPAAPEPDPVTAIQTPQTQTRIATPTPPSPSPRTLETPSSDFAPSAQPAQPARSATIDVTPQRTDEEANSGWVQDLLRRASNEPAAAPTAPAAPERTSRSHQTERSAEHIIESLYSLSVDIARIIDRDATIELWERYQRGERNVFTRRLRSLEGVQLRDEIRRHYSSNPDFIDNVNRYISDFEVLILEVSRRKDGNRQAEAYLNSDAGRLYTILAQATGRFD